MVRVCSPSRSDKNLGRAYNEVMQQAANDEWICFTDYDVLFLTPDAPNILDEYVRRNPDAGILTCWTNRISNHQQLLNGRIEHNDRIKYHIKLAEAQHRHLYRVTELKKIISGFLMVINKKTWLKFPFDESGLCLGVDSDYSRRILDAGLTVLRMEGMYCWHTYRLTTGINDKKHLI